MHLLPVADVLELPLRGPKGEPVDFARTIVSHGVAELAPNVVDLPGQTSRRRSRFPAEPARCVSAKLEGP